MRCSFEPRHQVVEQDADLAGGSRCEAGEHLLEAVGAVEQLDDDALDAQVVAPDLLDELGVVATLDEDPAGAGHARPGAGHRHRSGRRAGRGRGRRDPTRGDEDHRLALEQEAGAEGEGTASAATVLERERVQVAIDGDDLATQSVVTSSTTAPSSAGASTARPRAGARQSPDRTSVP